MNKLNLIYFSPTGTTLKVLKEVSSRLGISDVSEYNIKPVNGLENGILIPNNSLTIIGVPVYSGRIPLVIESELKKFSSNGGPVILVVVYGNRHYDDALLELHDIVVECGFKVVSAATFIGEHSFSTEETPVAVHRPDFKDVVKCYEYSSMIKEKMRNWVKNEDVSLEIPGKRPYKDRSKNLDIAPELDDDVCAKCGSCVEVCPTGAITINDTVKTDAQLCIWCGACLRACPENGRTFDHEVILGIREKLKALCVERREPEIFI